MVMWYNVRKGQSQEDDDVYVELAQTYTSSSS